MRNFYTLKKCQSPVGRTALCPTKTQTINRFNNLLIISIANTNIFYWIFDLCRLVSDRGQSDLRLFVMQKWHSNKI